MKIKKILSEQWVIVYILIAVAILYFIYSLGFMTNFYRLFYDGDSAMFEVYKELQLLNAFIFENALITLILSIIGYALDLNKKKCNILSVIYVTAFLIYEISSLSTILGAIPYYINKYRALDFTLMKNYNSSTVMFTLSYVFSIGILMILVAIAISLIIRIVKQKREKYREKSYE